MLVTVVIKGGVHVLVFLLRYSWTRSKGKAVCSNRGYISFVRERSGLALKEAAQDVIVGVCVLFVQLKGFFFFFY